MLLVVDYDWSALLLKCFFKLPTAAFGVILLGMAVGRQERRDSARLCWLPVGGDHSPSMVFVTNPANEDVCTFRKLGGTVFEFVPRGSALATEHLTIYSRFRRETLNGLAEGIAAGLPSTPATKQGK